MSIQKVNQQPSFKGAVIFPRGLIIDMVPELMKARRTGALRYYNYAIFDSTKEEQKIERVAVKKLTKLGKKFIHMINPQKTIATGEVLNVAEAASKVGYFTPVSQFKILNPHS